MRHTVRHPFTEITQGARRYNFNNTTHTPTIVRTPSLVATPQHSNVVASSSEVSKITPRSVGHPRKVQHKTRSTFGTHKGKGKNVRMKSSRRINSDDTDDEDETESQRNTHNNSESYSLCRGREKVMLPTALKNPPKLLMDLINRKHAKSTNFIDNIRRYNSMFAFTSMGSKQDKSVNTGCGPYFYRIQGMNYDRMGSLLSDKGKPPMSSQLYIYDTENEVKNKIKFASNEESTSSGKKKIDHQLTTNIRDMLDTNNSLVAKFWIVGSPRYMMQNYIDAMTLCKNFRYPNLFITFTCNPNWPKIARFVAEKGLKSEDRPDIITRVFKQKLDSQMKDFKEKCWFGCLRGEDKLTTGDHIDKYIFAEIPDKDKDPELYQIVTDHMMHGPCGAERPSRPCTVNNKCTKL
nr:helicase-like protein [Tanacetum cinerariifolium]